MVAATSTFCGASLDGTRTNGVSGSDNEPLSLALFLRDIAECPDETSVVLSRDGELLSKSSALISPQITNLGSSRGAAVSSALRDKRMVFGLVTALILSGMGRPL